MIRTRVSGRRELGDLFVTAAVAAALLAATAAATVGGRHTGPRSATSRSGPTAACPAAPDSCSTGSAVPVRLSLEPRTGVCLS